MSFVEKMDSFSVALIYLYCIILFSLTNISCESVQHNNVSKLITYIHEIATPLVMQDLFIDKCLNVSKNDDKNSTEKWFWGVEVSYKTINETILPNKFILALVAPIKVTSYSHEITVQNAYEGILMDITLLYDQLCSTKESAKLKPVTCGDPKITVPINKDERISAPKLLTFCQYKIWYEAYNSQSTK